MSKYLQFSLLWFITGSPVTAAIVLLVAWSIADWYAFGFGRRLVRFVVSVRTGLRLEQTLATNPHDRKARQDLAEILVGQGRYGRAIHLLKPMVAENPDDLPALFAMGQACLGSGAVEQGELFLTAVEEAQPSFRHGAAPLEIGRARLNRGDAKGAVEPLKRYLAACSSSVEGHYLLSRALALSGDAAGAELERTKAWHEHATSLPFQRRHNRLWAWRARPSRPATYVALLLAGMMVLGYATRDVGSSSATRAALRYTPEE